MKGLGLDPQQHGSVERLGLDSFTQRFALRTNNIHVHPCRIHPTTIHTILENTFGHRVRCFCFHLKNQVRLSNPGELVGALVSQKCFEGRKEYDWSGEMTNEITLVRELCN